MITKNSTYENDRTRIRYLLVKYLKAEKLFRDRPDTHGVMVGYFKGLPSEGLYNDYKKAKRSLDFNLSKLKKKYNNPFSLYADINYNNFQLSEV